MTIRSILLPIAGATLLLAGLTAHAQAYQCLTQSAVGTAGAYSQSVALVRAKADWSNTVQNALTLQYSVYEIANDKEESCSRTGRRYQCRVEAEPCAYVVG